jgi:hypothetical protein
MCPYVAAAAAATRFFPELQLDRPQGTLTLLLSA